MSAHSEEQRRDSKEAEDMISSADQSLDATAPKEVDPFGDESGAQTVYKNLNWWEGGFCMIAETISLGILSLPKVISTMGFIPGFILILFYGILCTYTGFVVGQFRQAHPSVHSFADAAGILGGKVAYHIVSVAQALILVFIVAAHVLTFSIMMNVLTSHGTCTVTFAFIGTVLSLILTLPRTLKSVSWLSGISCASIMTAVIVTMIAIGIVKPSPNTAELFVSSQETSVLDYSVGISNILLSFSGHTAYFSFISELKDSRDFPKSLALLNTLCVTAYVVVAVVIYAYAGDTVASPALSSAGPVVRKVAYGIAIPTIVIAGVVNAHVFIKNIYIQWWRGTNVPGQKSFKSLGSWYLLTIICYIIAFVIANAIPVFSDLLGILGALLCTWFSLGIPSIFWLALNKDVWFKNWRKSALTVLNMTIFLVCCASCGLGTWASVKSIIASSTTNKPFSCADNS